MRILKFKIYKIKIQKYIKYYNYHRKFKIFFNLNHHKKKIIIIIKFQLMKMINQKILVNKNQKILRWEIGMMIKNQ